MAKPDIRIEITDVCHQFHLNDRFRLIIKDLAYCFNGPLGLYGLSGSGKTTLCKILAGIIKPQSGDFSLVKLNGTLAKPAVVYSPQFPEKIFLGVRVSDTLKQIMAQHPLGEEIKFRLIDYLHKFSLDYQKIENKSGFELSGGELRRFALALSLSLSPDLLIMDEPTIGMGPKGKQQLCSVIKDFQENYHVLIVSHDFNLIRKICRQFWILQHGSLIFSGDLEELNAQHAIKEQVGIHSFEKVYCFSDI
ncbi:MAG TPA: hypothetical protein DHW42_00650 [Candidatus Marinimicrobia bacterium]|nr:hypothetical protein [Candidatus Neomarinimicrobiota bacterium]